MGSLVISGLLGIGALLAGEFSELQVKVLLSSLTVSGGSILALACAAALERGRFSEPARVGLGLAILATVLMLLALWPEIDNQYFWKVIGSAVVGAVALALLSLLELATVAGRFARITIANRVASAVLAGLILLLIWFEPSGDGMFRAIAIASIVVTVLAVATPVLHYVSRLEANPGVPATLPSNRGLGERPPTKTEPVSLAQPPPVLHLRSKFAQIHEHWKPHIVAELNGQSVRLARVLGTFDWHKHDQEDEFFLVLEGTLTVEFRSGQVTLQTGDALVVPRGVEHRPSAETEARILLFEPSTTLNTGDAESEFTLRELPRI